MRIPYESEQQQPSTRYLAYRLKAWPDLHPRYRTAPILRALSRMTLGPVTHKWLVAQAGLPPEDVEALLRRLVAMDAVHVLDLGATGMHDAGASVLPAGADGCIARLGQAAN